MFEIFFKYRNLINGIKVNEKEIGEMKGEIIERGNVKLFINQPGDYTEVFDTIDEDYIHLRDLFLANIGHELRTPLNSINGNIELLTTTHLNDEQLRYLDSLKECTYQMLGVIEDILDYTRIKNGRLVINYEETNLYNLMECINIIFDKKIKEKGLNLRIIIDKDLKKNIIIDPKRIKQILINLITNSIKFTRVGEITLKIDLCADSIKFLVEDTGCGIPKDKLNIAFQSFAQFVREKEKKYDGTGLGLFICKNLINLMNGSIDIDSTENVGTKVTFSIPYKPCEIEYNTENLAKFKGKSVMLITNNFSNKGFIFDYLLEWKMQPFHCDTDYIKKYYERLVESGIHYDIYLVDQEDENTIEIINKLDRKSDIVVFVDPKINNIKEKYKIIKPVSKNKLFETFYKLFNKDQDYTEIIIHNTEKKKDYSFLVAEDSIHSQNLLVNYLNHFGYSKVFRASNGLETLDILERHKIDILLLDIKMDVMDGFECSREIVKRFEKKDRPVIIGVSAFISENDVDKCYKAGMNDFISKPVKMEPFRELLNKYL
jgi:signal transduction histidine kinase/CheY-like chemotaxis protein